MNDTPTAAAAQTADAPRAEPDHYVIRAGAKLTIDAAHGLLANDVDPNGLPLRVIVDSMWWGRGFAFDHRFEADGSFTLQSLPTTRTTFTSSYKVVNGAHETDTATVTIKILNDAPVAEPDHYRVHGARMLIVPAEAGLLANDHDPEGTPFATDYALHHGMVGELITQPSGALRYVAPPGYTGVQERSYTVRDEYGGESTGRYTIEVYNAQPVGGFDEFWIHPDKPYTIDPRQLLANDRDADVDALSITHYNFAGLEGTGKLVALADGTYRYTPDATFRGLAKFGYTVADGVGGVAGATVHLHVGNQAPAVVDDDYAVQAGRRLSVRADAGVLANDRDAEGDRLVVTLLDTAGLRGQLAVGSDGRVDFIPEPGFVGKTTARFVVVDEGGARTPSSVTFSVQPDPVVNQAPVAADDRITIAVGTATRVDVLANDQESDRGQTLRVSEVGAAGVGQVALQRDGSVVYTPRANWNGEDRWTYTVHDGFGGTDRGEVVVVVVGTHVGTEAGESLNGWRNADSIDARGGNDWISALDGNDFVRAGDGDDVASGGNGDDVLLGGRGRDTLRGDDGADVLVGGPGSDTILTGGADGRADAHADRVVFDTAPDAATNLDVVHGFDAGSGDRIVLDPAVYAALRGGRTTGIDATEFVVAEQASKPDHLLLWNPTTQVLSYDADGNGPAAPVPVAAFVGLVGTVDLGSFVLGLPPGL